MANLNAIIDAFGKTQISLSGVSFSGKGLKLNHADDAKEIIEAIEKCPDLQYLNLEGNTLGVEAAKSLSKALETRKEFKRAIWRDMFTGRMKDEIPIALSHLGDALVTANAKLVELNLSDNAFGPIGLKGLAALLKSPCCYALEELRLNNNGLGIGGAELLANALMDCYTCSKNEGKPLALRVFIAGRNRLENPGATFLAKVFKTIGTLEEVAMPQNSIYTPGITALSDAFKHNPNLEIINLNDNTIGPSGAAVVGPILPTLKRLKCLNLGDCLLKTKGARTLADCLKGNVTLEELILDSNEIRLEGGLKIVDAMANKMKLKKLSMNENCFGDGIETIVNLMQNIGKANVLDSFSGDEGDDDEEEDVDVEGDIETVSDDDIEPTIINKQATLDDFLQNSSIENFLGLGEKRCDVLLKYAMRDSNNNIENCMQIIMKVSSLLMKTQDKKVVMSCCENLYSELLTWCQKHDKLSIFNNNLLVNLSLIKSEDKKFKPIWNIESCIMALENVIDKNYFPESTRSTLKVFISKDISNKKEFFNAKQRLLTLLT